MVPIMDDADRIRYEIACSRFDLQIQRIERLNSRAAGGAEISGVLMTLFLTLGGFVISNLNRPSLPLELLKLDFFIGLGLFAIDMFVFLWAYKLELYRYDPDPGEITEGDLTDLESNDLIRLLTKHVVDSTIENHETNNQKARTIKIGFYFLGFSIYAVLVFGVLVAISLPR